MAQFKEVVAKAFTKNNKAYNVGEVIRKVSLSDREAQVLNSLLDGDSTHIYKYDKITEAPKTDEKELRKSLFAKLEEAGQTAPKNIKTEDLQAKVDELC